VWERFQQRINILGEPIPIDPASSTDLECCVGT
jgi:hypothetical protein